MTRHAGYDSLQQLMTVIGIIATTAFVSKRHDPIYV